MEFSSLIFIFLFLPVFLLFFLALRKTTRNIFLLIASLVFYAWGEGSFVLLLLGSVVGNYLLGLAIDKTQGKKAKKIAFILAMVFNIGMLVYFKYTLFLLENLGIENAPGSIHQPLGISFFTFQALSYIIDIYRQTVPNDTNPLRFGLYMTLFPKLLMGPIIPYHNLSKQIIKPEVNYDNFAEGVKRFIIGLGKKILIADVMARVANQIFAVPAGEHTPGLAWTGIVCYTLQIFFDFAGYSDMAIGLGRMMGFKLPENFNYPYIANSIKDFWTRWHITLAHWLRDYLFLPIAYAVLRRIKQDRLLGVKAENWSYYISAFITFLICGIWHGANWTFFVWGAYYGVLLGIEHAGLRKFMKRKFRRARIPLTQLLVMIGWVFFRSPNLSYAFSYLKTMFGIQSGSGNAYYPALYLDNEVILFLIIGIIGSYPLVPGFLKWYRKHMEKSIYRFGYAAFYNFFLILIFLLSTMVLVSGTYNPFIYFRF